MLEYIFAGIALGSIYAIAASGLVITYVSAGVLNFAFGSMAFFLARFYYYLNTQQHWGAPQSLLVSVVLSGPALGAVLYFMLFQHLRLSSSLIKIVSTIGLSVALPPAATLLFGNQTITTAPGLAHAPVRIYKIFNTSVTLDQLIAFGCVVAVVVIGTAILQLTDVGLRVRAMVDTEALTSLSGVNPSTIAVGVWMVSCTLAGLAGVLAAPASGLTVGGMTALMSSAFAAVVAARLRSLPIAVGVAMGMGIVTEVIQKYLPVNNSLSSAAISSIPFAVIVIFLVAYIAFSGQVNESSSTGGALDAAIRPQGGSDTAKVSSSTAVVTSRSGWSIYMLGPVIIVGIAAILPLVFNGFWLTLVGSGFAFAIIFLSFTMVVGEGGMIWLCQAGFAGVGAIGSAQLATNHGWNPILAVFAAGLIAVPIGLAIGMLTIRLGNLYVALATLSFGLLAETLIFTRNVFYQDGIGVAISRPAFLSGDRAFSYFGLTVFVILAIILVNLRRSTTGLAMAAVRFSEPASKTLGLSVLKMKLIAAGFSTFIAAVGGGLVALDTESALPTSYATFAGLVWLAVLVTNGIRSVTAALLAGLSFTLLPAVFQIYLPSGWGDVPTLLFGLGAIGVAVNPDGVIAMQARQIQGLITKLARSRSAKHTDPPGGSETAPRPTEPGLAGAAGTASR
ncbi:ABC transporter permease [Jatrophihabitans sp. DSM 45814]